MFEMHRARLIALSLGVIGLAGCGSYGGGGGGGGGAAPAVGPTSQSATLAWSDASGPVAGYRIFVSRNGSVYAAQQDVAMSRATINGAPGDRVRIQVAAFDSSGNMGPRSLPSDELLFTDTGVALASAASAARVAMSGSTVTRSMASRGDSTSSIAPDSPDASSDPTSLAGDGASLLLWEADAPSLTLQLTGLWQGSLQTELSFDRPGEDWWVAGTADFDGDGSVDVLWESATRMLAFSPAATLEQTAPVAPLVLLGEAPEGQLVVATGDFDGDGRADLLLEDEVAAAHSLWRISAAGAQVEEVTLPGRVAGSGDFDGDGHADVVCRDADGSLSVHFMDGALDVASLGVPGKPEPLASGDLDGDGDDDLVVRDVETGADVALMMGARQAPIPWSRSIAAGPGFDVASVGDFDGDGAADLLWVSETGFVIGFYGPEDAAGEWLPVEPGADWLLVSFAL